MNFLGVLVRRPVFTTMIVASMVVLGLASFGQLGVDIFPKVDLPTITITTRLPGAAPEEIESQISKRIELTVEAYPGMTFPGEVTRLSPAVEVQTRSLALEGRVGNTDGRLRPGFFTKGQVLTRKEGAVAFVPAESVVYFVGISKVVVVANGKVEERVVRAGGRQGPRVEILDGVKVGETVAASNLSQLFDGAPVTLVDTTR